MMSMTDKLRRIMREQHMEQHRIAMAVEQGIWTTVTTDNGIKATSPDGCEVIIKLDMHDGSPVISLEPQAGTSLEGEEPGLYYVVPA